LRPEGSKVFPINNKNKFNLNIHDKNKQQNKSDNI